MKFKQLITETLINELDMTYLLKQISSKLRGILRIFGLFPIEKMLIKYPEIGDMYQSLIFGDEDYNEIEKKFKTFLKENPKIFDEIKVQIKKNVMDLNIDYIKDSLNLMLDILDPDIEENKEKIEKIKDLLELESETELRKGLLKLVNDEIKEVEEELKKFEPFKDEENIKKYKSNKIDSDEEYDYELNDDELNDDEIEDKEDKE